MSEIPFLFNKKIVFPNLDIVFTGTARLPEASENPLLLKQVVRKPLEAVLRYLGKYATG